MIGVRVGMLLLNYDAVEGGGGRASVRPMKRLAEVGSARQSSLIAATTTGTGASASAGQGPTVRLRYR